VYGRGGGEGERRRGRGEDCGGEVAGQGDGEGRVEGGGGTFWSFDADLLEELSLLHGPDDSFHKLFDLFVQASNIGVLLCRLLVHFHGFDSAVIFRW